MKLTILGGGGFRVPLVYGALLRDHHEPRIDRVTLYDVDEARLDAVAHVLAQQAGGDADAPTVGTTTDLKEALEGTDFVFSAIRVGGLAGRSHDERVALDLDVLGQETTGPGGIAYGLRTVPVALEVARAIREVAPSAHVINFTNPAGMITEAMQSELGDRVVGICDSPIGLARRAAVALGLDPAEVFADYVGLNHLGWVRRLLHDGVDVLPQLLADDAALERLEEARLFGVDWIRTLGALPNEYLYYFYFNRDAVASIKAEPRTRGEFLERQQRSFYETVADAPDRAWDEWRRVRAEREETYMAEVRGDEERQEADGGGYEGVALAFMAAVMRGEQTSMILDVRNGTAVAGLPPEAVVEVPCHVDGTGARPLAIPTPEGYQLGLMQQVKAVEQLTIEAARSGDPDLAVKAFALHPLVPSVNVAHELAQGYGVV